MTMNDEADARLRAVRLALKRRAGAPEPAARRDEEQSEREHDPEGDENARPQALRAAPYRANREDGLLGGRPPAASHRRRPEAKLITGGATARKSSASPPPPPPPATAPRLFGAVSSDRRRGSALLRQPEANLLVEHREVLDLGQDPIGRGDRPDLVDEHVDRARRPRERSSLPSTSISGSVRTISRWRS